MKQQFLAASIAFFVMSIIAIVAFDNAVLAAVGGYFCGLFVAKSKVPEN